MKSFAFFIFFFVYTSVSFYSTVAIEEQGNPNLLKSNNFSILVNSSGHVQVVPNATVSQDGKGDYTRIIDAIADAPSASAKHYVIFIKKGVYREYIDIDHNKNNLVLIGEGKKATLISGNRRVNDVPGHEASQTATFAVKAQGFIAIDIGFENTAGQKNKQAVALLSGGNHSVFYRCMMKGDQDTLLVDHGLQFYRECYITGTVDFIFGDGTAVFQNCSIFIKKNQIGGTSVITAHGRNSSTASSGFSFQFCDIIGDKNMSTTIDSSNNGAYLGRPWHIYARTVFMQSSIRNVLRPEGWLQWKNSTVVDKLYFGEYQNSGPGAALGGRVKWPGFHKMSTSDADKFTVQNFIDGNSWLKPLGIPYTQGLNTSAGLPRGA